MNMRQRNFEIMDQDSNKHVPFLSQIKWQLIIGNVTGVFPLSDYLMSKSCLNLVNKKLSLAYIYSALTLCVKLLTLKKVWELFGIYNYTGNRLHKIETPTVIIAGNIGFVMTFGFGTISHILNVLSLGKFLNLLQLIERYDIDYDFKDILNFSSCRKESPLIMRMIMVALVNLLIIYTPIYVMYLIIPVLIEEDNFNVNYFPPRILRESPIPAYIFFTIGFILLEFGNSFSHFQLFVLSNSISRRFKKYQESIDLGLTVHPKQLSKQYNQLNGIIKAYEDFSGPYFVVMYASLIVSFVCMSYYTRTSRSQIVEDCMVVLDLVTYFTLGRLTSLPNCGKVIEMAYKDLVKTLMKLYHKVNFEGTEYEQFSKYMKLVIGTKVSLKASGFFSVNSTNITSIAGVIITYIIVLFQFGLTDNPGSVPGLSISNNSHVEAMTMG